MSFIDDTDSNNSLERIFGEPYKYPKWFSEKKYKFYRKILQRLNKLITIHSNSSLHYNNLEKYIFGPSIMISCLSGIASFLSTSQFIDNNTQNVFGISVGILASISTLLQSLGSAYRFSAKEEAHRQTADEYNKLSVKIKFEMEMPNEEDFTDKLEQEILDIQNKCNYFVPQFILDNYEKKEMIKLNNRILCERTPLISDTSIRINSENKEYLENNVNHQDITTI